MSKKFFTTMIMAVLLVSAGSVAVSQIDKSTVEDLYAQIELFSYALTTIHSEYVEEKTAQELIYGSLKGMLASLDPHSQFMDPEEYKELKSETSGKFGGLGIEISIRDGLLTVVTPIEDTPAWRAGLLAGDRIVKIEDELTKDMTLSDAVKKLRGDPGTDVHITILREQEFKILDVTITREIISIDDVKHVQILDDNIGYIRLVEFRENSGKAFYDALEDLKSKNADSLVIDLRNNPGGLLNVAIEISNMFLPKDMIIVSTRGRHKAQDLETHATQTIKDKFIDWPVVVLINEGSASGSEILAGALKDNKRAVILGTQSFGKGSVQSVIPLPDGSGLRLTTSKYFTPSGVSIHGTGITPDIVVERVYHETDEKEEKEKDLDSLFEKVEKEAAPDPLTTGMNQEQKKVRERLLEDNQIQSAISVLKGIKVYKRLTNGGTPPSAVPDAASNETDVKEAAPSQDQTPNPLPIPGAGE